MSKKARLLKKTRRHAIAEVRRTYGMGELEKGFEDLLVYGMIVKRQYPDGKVERYYPIFEP